MADHDVVERELAAAPNAPSRAGVPAGSSGDSAPAPEPGPIPDSDPDPMAGALSGDASEASPTPEGPEEPASRTGLDPAALELAEHPVEDLLGGFEVKERDVRSYAESAEATALEEPARPGAAAPKIPPLRRAPQVSVAGARRARSVRTQVGEEQAADRRRARKGAAFMGVMFLVYMAWIVVSGQADEFATSLATADWGWLGIGVIFMAVRFAFGSLAYVFAVYIDPDSPVGVRDCMSLEANGTLFGNLTPMNSGAVPAQIYRLTKAGLDVGEATATQFTRFIFYQAGEVIVAAVLLWLKFDFFLQNYGNFVILNLVVFVIQTLQAVSLLVVCLFPRFVVRIGNWGIRFAQRHGWLAKEKAQKYLHVVNVQVSEFSVTFKESFKHKASLFLTWLVTLGMLVCFYAVPWIVLRAFGGDADFLECLAAGAMVQMIGNSVPLPGGAGGNEAGFAFFFGPIFGASAAAGFVAWRIITYFIPTGACLPLSALRSGYNSRSIYQRWNSFRANHGRTAAYSYRNGRQRRR